MPTSTVEDYLKCIYMIGKERGAGEPVTTGQIAAHLHVAPGTVTAMVKALSEAGLVSYAPYTGVRLAPAGARLATHVLRRHRIVELFLVRVMGMNWGEVHEDAELLEHAVSDRLIERMDQMLGRPANDPHGDPIPSARGAVSRTEYPSLLGCEPKKPHRVARVMDQGTSFLRLMERHGVLPGRRLRVERRDDAAETLVIRADGSRRASLSFSAAAKILVEPL